MKVTKKINQDFYIFILTYYGNLDYISNFLNDNNIEDIEEFDNSPIGTIFTVNPIVNPIININVSTIDNPYKFYENKNKLKLINENFFDFMLNNYGGLSSLNTFFKDNPGFTFSSFTASNINVYKVNNIQTNQVLESYFNYNYKIITGESNTGADYNNDFNIDFLI
jgi:hypothetical protein